MPQTSSTHQSQKSGTALPISQQQDKPLEAFATRALPTPSTHLPSGEPTNYTFEKADEDYNIEGNDENDIFDISKLQEAVPAADIAAANNNSSSCNLFLTVMVALTTVTGFLMGYDLCIVAVVLGPIRDTFRICPPTENACVANELFVAILAPGAMVSSIFAGWLSDRIGRRAILLLSDVFFTIAATVMALAQSYWLMLCGRALLGFGIGMGFVVFPTYMAEVAPAHVRGLLVTCQEISQCIGCLFAYGVAYGLPPVDYWRLLLFMASVPAVLQFAGTLFLPESPRWLVAVKRIREANAALEKISGHRDFCGRAAPEIDCEEEAAQLNFIESVLVAPGLQAFDEESASVGSKVEQVRATRQVLHEMQMTGKRIHETDIRNCALTVASRSASRTSFDDDYDEDIDRLSNDIEVHKGTGSPLNTLLDLMEEVELREEAKVRRKHEERLRYMEEVNAARSEGTLSLYDRFEHKLFLISTVLRHKFRKLERLALHAPALAIAVGCAIAQNFTGANTILYYSVDIMERGGVCDPLFPGVMIGVVKLTGVIFMASLLERVGRRFPLILGTTGTILCHISMGLVFKLSNFENTCGSPFTASESGAANIMPTSTPSIAVVLLLWGLMFCWSISWAALMFVVAAEVLPSSIRGLGMGLTIAFFWMFAFVFQVTFRLVSEAISWGGTFFVLAGTSALVLFFVLSAVPDLTGKTLEEISK